MAEFSSRAFEVSFNGPCALGCDGLREGDQAVYASKSASVPQHVPGECRNSDPLAVKHGLCSSCQMALLPTGECPMGCDS